MCTTCGCGDGDTRIEGQGAEGWHRHADGTLHHHAQPGAHAHGATDPRRLRIEQDLLAANDAHAARNRARFAHDGIFALNLVSSPGSGKTTLLCRTIQALRGLLPVSVIEGDQQTRRDAERIRAAGAGALQVNTGKGCHLDAHMVSHAIAQLDPAPGSLLLIENVGNLVCPAEFEIGEDYKLAILSTPEGDDKPLKYPLLFHLAKVVIINKSDLLPYLDFDMQAARKGIKGENPKALIFEVSAKTGRGFEEFCRHLEKEIDARKKKN